MAKATKTCSKQALAKFDRTVVYRGIKIPPISGTRSATALAIRDAFLAKVKQ